jgi:hypothetical protein
MNHHFPLALQSFWGLWLSFLFEIFSCGVLVF